MAFEKVLNRQSVIQAITEFDRVGEAAFLSRYGFRRALRWCIRFNGRLYPSKAIYGVAYQYESPGNLPLSSSDFTQGEGTVRRRLEQLDFELVDITRGVDTAASTRWWAADPNEMYWLETTDRQDLGVDLNAPQAGEDGRPYWAYSLIREVREGDIIFHYSMPASAVVSWSRAVGQVWSDDVVWGAHTLTSKPYRRPGWRLGLEGPFPLLVSVTLRDLRAREAGITAVRNRLIRRHRGSIYFPFELSTKRPLRPTQFYMTKMPSELVALFPRLASIPEQTTKAPGVRSGTAARTRTRTRRRQDSLPEELGIPYVPTDEQAAATQRDPFSVDPNVVDRGRRGHATTQNALADYVRRRGFEPRSPSPDEPQFDLAWDEGLGVFVAEVKSITDGNEEQQLRLGLGQVLRYRQLLGHKGRTVSAVLVAEREPHDPGWHQLCEALGVLLLWPEAMASRKE